MDLQLHPHSRSETESSRVAERACSPLEDSDELCPRVALPVLTASSSECELLLSPASSEFARLLHFCQTSLYKMVIL